MCILIHFKVHDFFGKIHAALLNMKYISNSLKKSIILNKLSHNCKHISNLILLKYGK